MRLSFFLSPFLSLSYSIDHQRSISSSTTKKRRKKENYTDCLFNVNRNWKWLLGYHIHWPLKYIVFCQMLGIPIPRPNRSSGPLFFLCRRIEFSAAHATMWIVMWCWMNVFFNSLYHHCSSITCIYYTLSSHTAFISIFQNFIWTYDRLSYKSFSVHHVCAPVMCIDLRIEDQ